MEAGALVPVETAEERQKKQMEGVPDLPPLLAQILAETRAKQERAKARREAGLPDEEEDKAKARGGGKPGDPLLLEAPSGAHFKIATHDAPIPKESDSEDSGDEEAADAPPGPPDAARCRVHGPGFSGAAAGQPVTVTITARDAAGKRVREGGAHILVMVEPAARPGQEEELEVIEAEVEDHGNGSYTASYAVPTKGNYQLHIEVNGEALGDSPFPIFFSAPVAAPPPAAAGVLPPPPAMPGQPGAPPGMAAPNGVMTAEAIKAASQQATGMVGGALAGVLGAAEAAAMGLPPDQPALQASLGVKLAQTGMMFPPSLSDEQASHMVVVGDVPAEATADAVEKVFKECGRIRTCTLLGVGSGLAFIEFHRSREADAALKLKDPVLLGQVLRVEAAREAKKAADAVAMQVQLNSPYFQLQVQQVQQFQMMQQQQQALAEQVASMRAAQRTGVAPPPIVTKYQDGDAQKSAAIAAAIELSRRLAGGMPAPTPAPAPAANGGRGGERRQRSTSRDKDRDRGRDGGRQRRSSRSREREVRRRRSSRSRSRDKRRPRREDSRDRRRRRSSRSRSPDRSKHSKHRHSHKDRKERRRSRSRDRKERSGRGDKEVPPAAAAAAGEEEKQQQEQEEAGDVMEVDVPAVPAGAKQAQQSEAELEALLEELGE